MVAKEDYRSPLGDFRMIRGMIMVAAFGMAMTAAAPSMAAPAGAAASADMQAKFQQQAEKSCNDDLDHDRFGNYGTMDECVSDKAAKLQRSYSMQSRVSQNQPISH